MALLQSGRLQDAELVFQSVLSMDPKNVNALQLLGIIQFQTGRSKEGEQLLRRAIKQRPNIADLHYNLGNMLDQQGKLKQALMAFENAIKLGLSNDQIHNNLGMVQSKLGKFKEAENSFRKAININPKNPSALSNYGLLMRKTNRQDQAIQALQQAIDLEPKFFDAFSNLGAIYFEKNDLDKAEEYLLQALELDTQNSNVMNGLAGVLLRKEKDAAALAMIQNAMKLCPDSIDVMLNMAKVLLKMDDVNGAEATYHRISKIMPSNIDALVGLGSVLSKQGKFGGARENFEKALEIDPERIAAHVELVSIDSPDVEDSEIIYLRNAYEDTAISDEDKMRIAFCLGKTYEKAGKYNEAFSYLADGNRLKRENYEYSLADERKFFSQIKTSFNGEFFQDRSDCGCKDKTPIFILGMPRSGTTLTEQILSSHPLVFGAGELPDLKKILIDRCGAEGYEVFPEKSGLLCSDDYIQMGRDYLNGLRTRYGESERVTDKMPHNFLHVGMIRLMLPNAKVIHCRRDPIDNCLSIYKQNFAGVHKYAYDLKELGGYHLLYQDLMEHWHQMLPGFMFDLQYEDLVADQEGMTRRLLEFCELPWDEDCLQFHKSERMIKTASYTQVRKKIYSDSVKLWHHYEAELQPLIEALAVNDDID